jgi:hypothetical protein
MKIYKRDRFQTYPNQTRRVGSPTTNPKENTMQKIRTVNRK